jgi:peroxiredoxin Q/BCP
MSLSIGDNSLEFCLPNQEGIEISLKDLIGKWVVLYFYPKDNTPGCTTQACDFTSNNSSFEDMDAIIVGVSPDSVKKHQKFIEKQNLEITLLSDEDKEVAIKYNVWKLKKLYGREYMGIVRTTFIIDPDGKIAYIWNNVKVKEHISDVLVKLKQLRG